MLMKVKFNVINNLLNGRVRYFYHGMQKGIQKSFENMTKLKSLHEL